MTSIVHRGAVAAIAASGAFAGLTAVAQAQTVKGVVVHHNRRAHSFVVADQAGRLFAVHASHAPRIGSQVRVAARRLRDGTYALQHERSAGHAVRHVRIRGAVTWVNHRTGAFTVSAPGVSMLVVRPGHSVATTADATAPVGSEVVVTGTVDNQGELEDQSVQEVGQSTGGVDLEGTILAVDPVARTITVSADDEDASGASIAVSVPSTFDISQYAPGQEVELLVQPSGAGTATLLGSAEDANAQAADDQTDEQGNDPGSQDGGGNTGYDGGYSGPSQSDGGSNPTSGGGND